VEGERQLIKADVLHQSGIVYMREVEANVVHNISSNIIL